MSLTRHINLDWLPIARGQYKVSTSRIREIRRFLPYILIGGAFLWIFVITPILADYYTDDLQALILSQVALAMIQFFLFYLFLIFVTLPITSTLGDIKTEHLEVVLSAPIRPSNLLIGEFLGKFPFYAIIATIVAGLFTGSMFILGLDVIQIMIIVVIFILIFSSALWIGNVIAVLLRTFLVKKSSRGKDFGRAIAILIVIPLVLPFYLFIAGYLEALRDPEVARLIQDILSIFPSSWGAEVIIEFARNPSDLVSIDPIAFIQLGGLIIFFLGSLYIGGKAANRAFSLEPSTFSASEAKADGIFYNSIKLLGGKGSFGVLLSSVFKNYFRNIKNLTWVAYAVGLTIISSMIFFTPDGAFSAFMQTRILSPLLGAFVASEITLQGKENLLLYKQTPSGTSRYLKAKIFQYLLIILPIVIIFEVMNYLRVPTLAISEILLNVVLSILIAIAITIFIVGLFLVNPAYEEKSAEYPINLQICIFSVLIPFFIGMILFDSYAYDLLGFINRVYSWVVAYTGIIWSAAIGMFALGVKKLQNLE